MHSRRNFIRQATLLGLGTGIGIRELKAMTASPAVKTMGIQLFIFSVPRATSI